MKHSWAWAVAALGLAGPAVGQEENVRKVDRLGEQVKILTPGQVDAWVFEGKAGETVTARVSSELFDPVLELVDDKDAKLVEVDDPGSQSQFAAELPRDGTFRVRVLAFKNSGGGKYVLTLDRFTAPPVELDSSATGAIAPQGRGHHRFMAGTGELLTVRLSAASAPRAEILNSKGQGLRSPSGLLRIEKAGTYYVRASGRPQTSYGIEVRRAKIRDLPAEALQPGEVTESVAEAWSFAGEPGQLAVIDLRRSGPLHVDVVLVPEDKAEPDGVIPAVSRLEELQVLERYEKGSRTRLACLLGRKGRYQAIVRGGGALRVPYEVRLQRAFPKLAVGGRVAAELPLGESALYTLDLQAGQVVNLDVATDRFDSVAMLYTARGDAVLVNDDRGPNLSSRMTYLSREAGTYLLIVSSLSHAGSGAYTVSAGAQAVREVRKAQRNEGNLEPGGVEIWQLRAAKGEMILLSVVSKTFDAFVSVYDARGVEVAADDNGGTETNSLVALRAAEEGPLTVWVSSKSGHGAYGLRLLEGE